ncbi:hypothetical protein [Bradyrhizobium sp. 1(2017)]|jgi:hypothetical protein|uniref:hypothetical protein n=1 Tax=Bradyrhizobium sp. 1(2017) TaxID=1404888 RepID=UPI00140F121F|nr:hypothetical protein [Bradyrhizobium sp. 1(2017)]QIO36664.1 hypothetical protein HAP40_35070 [Bradyrhizobium sp. 1(2017)]
MEKFRSITIEPQIGCDPVCFAEPDWNTIAPPQSDLPKIAQPHPPSLAVSLVFFSWQS